MPISKQNLISKATIFNQAIYENKQLLASLSRRKSAFLCHSHKDEALVKGMLVLFQEAGVDLYIDWNDHTMPDAPNAETARKIQEKIRRCDLFLFLATANSKASRWCPWEIGYADSSKKGIYIIPTSDGSDTYGNEYLELYAKIDEGSDNTKRGLAVFEAGKSNGQWLSSSTL
ncbi:MAG: hypothetical protein HW390_695 [Candidatus Brocadiaceae bacterium]|nr:hypothetical protein [Candidatus Brocadiaceae bacterium]